MSASVKASVVVVAAAAGGCVVVGVAIDGATHVLGIAVATDVVGAGIGLVVADTPVVPAASGTEPVPHPAAEPANRARVTTLVRPLDIGCISVA